MIKKIRTLTLFTAILLMITLFTPVFAQDNNALPDEGSEANAPPGWISKMVEEAGVSSAAQAAGSKLVYAGWNYHIDAGSGPYQEYFSFTGEGTGPSNEWYYWVTVTVGGSYVTAFFEDCCLPGDTVFVLLVSWKTKAWTWAYQTSSGTDYYPTGNPAAGAYDELRVPQWDAIIIVFGYLDCPGEYPAGGWFTVSLQP